MSKVRQHRSQPEQGEPVAMYVMGEADQYCDDVVRPIRDTAVCLSLGEDYSQSMWPVVVKVKPGVAPDRLANMLRNLALAVEDSFTFEDCDYEDYKIWRKSIQEYDNDKEYSPGFSTYEPNPFNQSPEES